MRPIGCLLRQTAGSSPSVIHGGVQIGADHFFPRLRAEAVLSGKELGEIGGIVEPAEAARFLDGVALHQIPFCFRETDIENIPLNRLVCSFFELPRQIAAIQVQLIGNGLDWD